ncbi:nonribosomal peptide synthase GliP2 [Xylariales sp. AK1849]|nr:nonribosomal peptide synthase GliP2 [Xylariales sp. AK1849]
MAPESLVDLFRKTVQQYPQKVVLEDWSEASPIKRQITYKDLDVASDHLAKTLRDHGIKNGCHVPILTTRSIAMVIAVLAVLKAGACYVPIDLSSWGQDRIETTLSIVGAKTIICTGSPDFVPVIYETLNFTETDAVFDERLSGDVATTPQPQADDLAYIIFTSGSTGKPKGVEVAHRSMVSYARGNGPESRLKFSFRPENRVLVLFSIAFDGCAGVLFSVLGNGGCLVIANPNTFPEAAKTCHDLPLTPSMLLALDPYDGYEKVGRIILGGETPPEALVEAWTAPGREIFNAYGPTETTCVTLMAKLQPGKPIVLGYPVNEAFVVLLDESGQESESGEICIGGAGVAVGYFKDQTRTDQVFVTRDGVRIYRTGDFGRITSAGIEFAGRKDSIVKNRGFLINLETEVEPNILGMPKVEAAVALVESGRLYAFVTPTAAAHGLRDKLLSTTSHFLVPDSIMGLDQLPITSNGKIDRKGLASRVSVEDIGGLSATTENIEPEQAVIKAFAISLKLREDSLSSLSSFSDLGGNSLSAVMLTTALKRMSYAVTLPSIFKFDTVHEISQALVELSEPTRSTDSRREEEDRKTALWQKAHTQLGDLGDVIDVAPMSDMQMRMLHGTLEDPSVNYLRLAATFNHENARDCTSRLRNAWTAALAHHSAFRTSFLLSDGDGIQLIHKDPCIDWHEVEVVGLPTETEFRAGKSASTQPAAIMLPHVKPLIKFNIYATTYGRVMIDWTVHHSLVDGWSMANVMKSVSLAISNQGILPPTPRFHEVVESVHRMQQLKEAESRDFWVRNLGNLDPIPRLTLPASLTTSSILQSEVSIQLGVNQSALERIARNSRVTPAAILYAAWSIVLSTYCASKDVVVGAVLAGRHWPVPDIEEVIGPLVNTLPLRVKVEEDVMSERLLQDVFSSLCDVAEHQWSSNSLVQSATGTKATEYFDSLLALQYDFPLVEWQSEDISAPYDIWSTETASIPLNVLIEYADDRLVARAIYHESHYEANSIKGMVRHFNNVLCALSANGGPQQRVSDVKDSMIDGLERDQIVNSFGHLDEPYIGPSNIKTTFEEAVDRYSQLPALECIAGSLTYGELEQRSNAVAAKLLELGSTSKFVPILADGSSEWIIAIMGIIKAGFGYCPIDHKFPQERQRLMAELAEADVMLYPLAGQIPSTPLIDGLRMLGVDTIITEQHVTHAPRPEIAPRGDDVVCLIFTSGSTGIPKGVQLTHMGLCSVLSSEICRYHACPGRRIAQLMAYGFDFCTHEVFSALLYGATLVLKNEENPFAHLSHVDATGITPSILATLDPEKYPDLKFITVSGEVCPQELSNRWAEGRTLINCYGPSETTISTTWGYIKPGDIVNSGPPAPRMAVYILDESDRPVPIGCTGEVVLSGIQITPGYLKLPERTRQSFIPDPFHPGLTMYRSGDVGRLTPNMCLEVIGRRDYQVKVRGLRVDLGEIESMIISAFSGVQNVAVVFIRDIVALAAYVTPVDIDMDALQLAIRSKLPYHCQPTRIVPLEMLPLNVNGKIDRNALASLKIESTSSAPLETPTEKLVARVWQQKLSISKLGALDNFFNVGGHSLLQIGVAQRLSEELGRRISLRIVIRNLVLRDLAIALDATADGVSNEMTPPFMESSVPASESLMSYGQSMLYEVHKLADHSTAWTVPFAARLHGTMDLDRLSDSIIRVIRRYPELRARFGDVNGLPTKTVSPFAFGPQKLSGSGKLTEALEMEFNQGFRLDSEQPVRIKFIAESEKSTILTVCMSHIVSDATTLYTFLQAVSEDYNRPAGVMDMKKTQPGFTDWAAWIASKKAGSESLQFWRDTLGQTARDPVTRFMGKSQTYTGRCRLLSIGTDVHQAIDRLANAVSATKHSVVLTAVGLVVQALIGTDEIVLGAPFANRDEPGTEDLVGLLLDRVPVKISISHSGNTSQSLPVSSLITQVKEASQAAIDHWIPYPAIMEAVGLSDRPGKPTLFDVMVTYHTAFETKHKIQRFGDCTMEVLRVHPDGAKYPLMFEFTETQDNLSLDIEYDTGIFSEAQLDGIEALITKVLSLMTLATVSLSQLRADLTHVVTLPLTNPEAMPEKSKLHIVKTAEVIVEKGD